MSAPSERLSWQFSNTLSVSNSVITSWTNCYNEMGEGPWNEYNCNDSFTDNGKSTLFFKYKKKRHFIKTRCWRTVLQSLEIGHLNGSRHCDGQKNESATSSAFFSGWQASELGCTGCICNKTVMVSGSQLCICLMSLCSLKKDADTCIVSLSKASS